MLPLWYPCVTPVAPPVLPLCHHCVTSVVPLGYLYVTLVLPLPVTLLILFSGMRIAAKARSTAEPKPRL